MNLKSKMARWYTVAGIQVLNTFFLLVLLNLLLFGAFSVVDRFAGTPQDRFESDFVKEKAATYPGWDESELAVFLRENDDVPIVFDPFNQFRVGQYSGKYVNVDARGMRRTKNQGPWPPPSDAFNVFMFGGSTTFGVGVPDDQTIASFLQELLTQSGKSNIFVYNFGRSAYFSTQERSLFEQLVAGGHSPNLAIFFDGLNEFDLWKGVPLWSSQLSDLVDQANDRKALEKLNWYSDSIDVLHHLPMYRVARSVKGELNRWQANQAEHAEAEVQPALSPQTTTAEAQRLATDYADDSILNEVINRWLANKKIIEYVARGDKIHTMFVLQPVPTYKYDINYHISSKGDFSFFQGQRRARYGYELLDRQRGSLALGENFLWLGDIQENRKENLYVDSAHYTAAFSKEIASRIYGHIIEQEFLPN